MNPFHPVETQRMPTLTEVIDLPSPLAPNEAPWPAPCVPDALATDPPTLPLREAAAPAPLYAAVPTEHQHGASPVEAAASAPPLHAEPAVIDPALAAALNQRVLSNIQRQVDSMLDYRLREALMPALARVTDTLVRELRTELSATLQDVVARAVAQELARQRAR